MLRLIILVVLQLCLAGCGMLQNPVKTSKENYAQEESGADLKILDEKENIKKSIRLNLYKDSNNQQYSVQLWPKGVFTLSEAGAFKGEAERIMITGKADRLVTASGIQQVQEQDRHKIELAAKQYKKKISGQKETVKRSTVSWKWVLAGTILILIIIYLIYRKFKPPGL